MSKSDLKIYHRKWYLKNREKKLKQNAAWARKNAARVRFLGQRWYEKNSARHCLTTIAARKRRQAKETPAERAVRREEINVKKRFEYAKNPDKFRAITRAWAAKNPISIRFHRIKGNYGLTREGFQALMTSQGGGCAICATSLKLSCHVDHDHSTGKVRGLLCGGCNIGLGRFQDSQHRLRKAIQYLKKSCV